MKEKENRQEDSPSKVMLFQSEKKRRAGKMELERHSVIDQLIKK